MLLLFITTTTNAKAESLDNYLAEQDKDKRKAEKIIGILNAVGITHPLVAETAHYIKENSRDDYFYFSENKNQNLNFGLRHELGTPKLERLELYMQPDDSNYVYTLSTEAVMVRYKVDISW
jgi:hypothetical protein